MDELPSAKIVRQAGIDAKRYDLPLWLTATVLLACEYNAVLAELEQMRARMAEGANAAFRCPEGLHPTWLLDPEVECPWCEVERLRPIEQRARDVLANPDEDEAWRHAARHLLGEA